MSFAFSLVIDQTAGYIVQELILEGHQPCRVPQKAAVIPLFRRAVRVVAGFDDEKVTIDRLKVGPGVKRLNALGSGDAALIL